MKVAIITEEQARELQGKEFAIDSIFNPVQDIDNNWVISEEEIAQISNEDFAFLRELELVDFKPNQKIISK